MKRDRAVADVDVAGRGPFLRRGSQIEREIATGALLRLGRDLIGDDVDQTADRVRTVQERGRAAHDFNSLGSSGIDRPAMITRLTRQVTETLAVLQNQDAVAIETANHWPGRGGTEAPRGDAGLTLERGTQRHPELFREFLSRKDRRRLEGLELTACIRTDREHFLEVQLGIDGYVHTLAAGSRRDLRASRRVPLRAHGQVIWPGRQVLERERAVRS